MFRSAYARQGIPCRGQGAQVQHSHCKRSRCPVPITALQHAERGRHQEVSSSGGAIPGLW